MRTTGSFQAAQLHIPALIVAACLALPAARAQSNYSANVLGYVDASFVAGSNLMANPLFALDNTISNLLRHVPNGSSFFPWNRAAHQFDPANQRTAGNWSSPLATLVAPDGGFLVLPTATKVSFVGQPWGVVAGPHCLTYPNGESVFSWIPQRCCAFDCDVFGPPPATDGETILRWNRQTQTYSDTTYYEGLGWLPSEPGPLDPDESALFMISSPIPLYAQGPFAGGLQTTAVATHVPSARMIQPQRDGTNFTFRWTSASNTSYAVFGSTNLRVVNWRLVDRGSALSTSGVCTVTFASTNPYAFYRLQPDWGAGPLPVLLGGHRPSFSNFNFQFYAPAAASYTVERAFSMSNPTWFTLTNFSAGPSNIVAVSDGTATDTSRYYRVRY